MIPRGRDGAEWIAAQADAAGREAATTAEPAAVRPVGADDDARTVEVEWIGEPSPIEDPQVAYWLLRAGQADGYTPQQAKIVRAAARLRTGRFPGHNRELTADRDGLSQDYVWGPKVGTYVRRVRFRDAEKIKASRSGHEFRLVGQEAERTPLVLPGPCAVRLVGEQRFSRMEAIAGLERGR